MTGLPMRVPADGKIREVWDVINEGRALTAQQIADRTYGGLGQIGPLLYVLTNMGAAATLDRGTPRTRYYIQARLKHWWETLP